MTTEGIATWLTTTVPGILSAGAAGSIIGALFLYFLGKVYKRILVSRDAVILWFVYPYGKEIEIGERVREHLGPAATDRTSNFLIYHITSVAYHLADLLTFIASASLLLMSYAVFGLDKPMLLIVLVAFTLLFASSTLKSGLRVSCHHSDALSDAVEKCEDTQPKFKEFMRNRD